MAVIAVMLVAGFFAVADGCGCCGGVVGRAVVVMICVGRDACVFDGAAVEWYVFWRLGAGDRWHCACSCQSGMRVVQ